MKTSSSVWLFALAGLVFVGLIGFAVYQGNRPSAYDAFAQCLSENDVVMYGAWWCPHCQNQKNLFGNAFEKVTYVECSPNGSKTMSQECQDAGITGYPTWQFADGTRLSGEQTFETLATRSSCALPETP